jgi:TRAP-type transport system periplasmic protein
MQSKWPIRYIAAVATIALAGAQNPDTLFVGSAAAQANNPIVMKLSTSTLNDTQHEWMRRFAAVVEKNSNGRIKAEIYPASQLGSIARQIEGTQFGAIQAWVGPPEFLVGVDQRFEILGAPGLFQTEEQAIKTVADADFAKAFLALGSSKGLVGASLFLSGGPVAFAMRAPVRALEDLKGKKIRILASQFQLEQIRRLGATGVAMTLGDVLPAIQQGSLDGAMSALQIMVALQYHDSAKYITETGHAYVFSVAMLNKKWLEGLPPDLQATVMSAGKQVDAEAAPWVRAFIAQQRRTWVDKGGELIALSTADHAELMQKMRPIGDDIIGAKPELKPVWDMLKATAVRSLSVGYTAAPPPTAATPSVPVASSSVVASVPSPSVVQQPQHAPPVVVTQVPSAATVRDVRVALVMGNANYHAVPKLLNPQRDASVVAESLRRLGFKTVQLSNDLSRDGIIAALRAFEREVEVADWAVVYYAGHGIEVGGVNYLVPVDAALKADKDVQDEAVPMERVLSAIESAKKLRLVILDACRDNPFVTNMSRSLTSRSIGRGLARIEPEGGVLVAYAAKHGQVALDGDGGNSPFVAALVKRLDTPGLDISLLFRLVRDDVLAATGRQQEPFVYGSLPGEVLSFRPQ